MDGIMLSADDGDEKKRDDSTTSPSIAYRIRSLLFCLWYHIVVSRSNY